MNEYLSKLNNQQRAAVEYVDGPSLVIAGAGSGKTRVLTYKIVHLLNLGYLPYNILALTFTNKAAREMESRIGQLVGESVASRLWMGTFHSVFLKLLRFNCDKIGFSSDFTIYDTADSKSLIKLIIKDLELDDKVYKANAVQSQISKFKNCLISPSRYENDSELRKLDNNSRRPLFYEIYKRYWIRCKVANAMDFDDILFYTNILLRDNPDVLDRYQDIFKYILVDEYQDTNFAQHLIISQLCDKHKRLCVVGDDAQSIYSFRGANINNILSLNQQFNNLKTFKLEQNYRSTQNIINAANSLIENNKRQIPKHIFSENDLGTKISVVQSYSGYEESYVVANKIIEIKYRQKDSYNDFAILYRTNAQSRILEESLRKRNIPYRIYGGQSFYQRKEVKDVISYFRISINPNDDEALRRIINYPARGIGETTVKKLASCSTENKCSFWNVINSDLLNTIGFNKGTKTKITDFRDLINSFIALNKANTNASDVANQIVRDTKIYSILLSDNTPENISRQENIQEVLNGVNEFVSSREEEGSENITLTDFLSEVSLATDQDVDTNDSNGERVTLMTIHAAKGLEFKNVIIVGVEEDLFPAAMSCDTIQGIEEERRLMYVAITRAKCNCIMTFANSRIHNGVPKNCVMSRFIREINPKYLSLAQTSISESKAENEYKKQSYNRFIDRQYTGFTSQQNHSDRNYSGNVIVRQKPNNNVAKTSDADYIQHDISEIIVGLNISHSRFGHGKILNFEDNGPESKITVNFDNTGTKTLLLKFAKFKIIR